METPQKVQIREKRRVTSYYIPPLDGLRALAVTVVIFGHHRVLVGVPTEMVENDWFFRFSTSTGTGVDLFFVMSGFLITSILLEIRENNGSMFSFWMRRVVRIAPLYFFYLSVMLVLMLFLGYEPTTSGGTFTWLEWAGLYAYLANVMFIFHGRVPQEFVILWSLAVEEQFYLVWPWLVKKLPLGELRKLMLICIGLAAVFRGAMYFLNPDADGYYFLIFCRMDSLLMGAVVAYLRTYGIGDEWRAKVSRAWPIAALLLLYFVQSKSYHHEMKTPFYIAYYYFLLAACWTVIVLRAIEGGKWVDRLLANRPIRFVGKVSYGLYIWHPLCGHVTNGRLTDFGLREDAYILRMAVMFAVSFVVATFFYFTLEKPFLTLKKHFPYFGHGDRRHEQERESDTSAE